MKLQRSFSLIIALTCGVAGAVHAQQSQAPDVFLKPYEVIDVSETGLFSGDRWLATVIDALTGGLRRRLVSPM